MDIFMEEFEQEAISRIQRFYKIAYSMGFEMRVGFSGGKDSQVTYDLCKRAGVPFRAFFNHAFESSITLRFIKENYPEVIRRRDYKFGFIDNITKNHGGLLPTVQMAYCCENYKHNSKYADECSIVGVRKAESAKRKARTAFEAKNKTILKKNKALINDYFEDHCQSSGSPSIIQLKPIIDWSDSDVWDYIYSHNLPINPEYKTAKRVGCIVCPKANFTSNYIGLMKYPKLINAFIAAREKGSSKIDWIIKSDGKDYSEDKCYYICRWLNRSFMPFTKKQESLYKILKQKYDKL
jgi:3'-phosphoadenosine 5'-phosphosulfate sulfotransferase (PAPS reductase)/FAD synthetase